MMPSRDRRLGTDLVRTFLDYLAGISRRSTFVDRTSFEMMRAERIDRAFAFDPGFHREAFETVP